MPAAAPLPTDIRTDIPRPIARVLPHPESIARGSEQFRISRFLTPSKAVRGRGLPLQTRGGVPVLCFDQGDEVGVFGVVVFDEYPLVLQPDDGDPISVVIRE